MGEFRILWLAFHTPLLASWSPTSPKPGDMGHPKICLEPAFRDLGHPPKGNCARSAGRRRIPRLQNRETWGTQDFVWNQHPETWATRPRVIAQGAPADVVSHVSKTGRHGAPKNLFGTGIPRPGPPALSYSFACFVVSHVSKTGRHGAPKILFGTSIPRHGAPKILFRTGIPRHGARAVQPLETRISRSKLRSISQLRNAPGFGRSSENVGISISKRSPLSLSIW